MITPWLAAGIESWIWLRIHDNRRIQTSVTAVVCQQWPGHARSHQIIGIITMCVMPSISFVSCYFTMILSQCSARTKLAERRNIIHLAERRSIHVAERRLSGLLLFVWRSRHGAQAQAPPEAVSCLGCKWPSCHAMRCHAIPSTHSHDLPGIIEICLETMRLSQKNP